MECKLTIIVDTHADNSLDVLFDGSLLCTGAMKCRIMSSIADALGMDATDMMVVGMMLKKGLTGDHITGEKYTISTRKPKDMEDD